MYDRNLTVAVVREYSQRHNFIRHRMDGTLSDALRRHGISLSATKVRRLDEYCRLLWDWNTRLNLTRHTDYEKFVSRDLVDALALAEFLRGGERVLDVGTGGGVPGIPLAILRPDLQIELCDSTGKKAMAVSEILRELKLNLPVWHTKVEKLLPKREKGERFTTLIVRAVSRLADFLRIVAPHWTQFDRLLLVKGPRWPEERGEARHHNLTNKLALRCLKTYPTKAADEKTVESVILQICRKECFDDLDQRIDARKNETLPLPKRRKDE